MQTLQHHRALESNNNTSVIPGRKSHVTPIGYDKVIYRLRRRTEQFFGNLKENRRITVRYEKTDIAFLAFIAVAIIKLYL